MTNQLAVTTGSNTPLDSLKDLHHLIGEYEEFAQDLLTEGFTVEPEGGAKEVLDIIETFRQRVADELAQHLGCTVHPRSATLEGPGSGNANVYDDGTPVALTITLGGGDMSTTVQPRHLTEHELGAAVSHAIESMNAMHAAWREEAATEQQEGPAIS